MRKLSAVLAILALSSMAAMAGGGFGLYGTYQDMDAEEYGIGGGLKLQADLAEKVLGFELRIGGLTGYGGDDPATEESQMASIEANLTLGMPLGDNVRLYVGAGGGYYVFPEFESKVAMGDSLEPDVDPEDVFGFFAVAGIELMVSEGFGFFGEVKYLVGEITELDVDGVTVEVDDAEFGGIGFNAGILFRF
ncbi:MAG: porin family protein [Verrucomicrobia bacterium]|nr:porin family protein [Verrucomicrobiota bacterium]